MSDVRDISLVWPTLSANNAERTARSTEGSATSPMRLARSRICAAMIDHLRAALAAFVAFALLGAAPASAEPPKTVKLADGRYLAAPPPGWDGKTRLPLLLYIHGYGQTPEGVLADQALMGAAWQAGVLVVLPAGENGAWTFRGSPHSGRDDVAFLHQVVADAERSWPVDSKRVIASGFSIGGSMVWELACHAADGFSAFLPFSGSFWVPYPEHCESGPVNLRHVHGLDDHTVPLAGRTIGLLWHQGDTRKSFELLKSQDACPAEPDRRVSEGNGLECQEWTGCGGHKQIQLCLHTGDHYVNAPWLAAGLAWALAPPISTAQVVLPK